MPGEYLKGDLVQTPAGQWWEILEPAPLPDIWKVQRVTDGYICFVVTDGTVARVRRKLVSVTHLPRDPGMHADGTHRHDYAG